MIFAGSTLEQPLPQDTEARMASFTELVATAIANADSRAELMASRAQIVAASDQARRRIERELHDGTQQRLVSLGLAARAAQANVAAGRGDLRAELPASRRDWPTRWPNCRSSRAGSTRRSFPRVVWARRCGRLPARTPFARLSATQRRQLHDLLLAAIEPGTDLREAQRQAAKLLGSIELD